MDTFIPLTVVEKRKSAWPDVVNDLMPLLCIFWRYKAGKPRQKKVKTHSMVGGKMVTTTKYVDYKRVKTSGVRDQNNFSVITAVILEPDDFGTIVRNLKHKGYREFVGALDPNEEEIERAKAGWRYYFYKYKSFDEMYNLRGVYDEFTEQMRFTLAVRYPCNATGQSKLF